MKKLFKKFLSNFLVVTFAMSIIPLSACSNKSNNQSKTETVKVTENSNQTENKTGKVDSEKDILVVSDIPICEEPKFNGVYIEKTIDEFNSLGFAYGDSVDILFSNGYELKDLPYYSGYYCKAGELLLVAYPGYDFIDACINNGDSLWAVGKFKDSDTATITLKEKGKYKNNQEFLNIKYIDNREDYSSDEVFVNFRNVKTGNLKDMVLYRGASPINNQHKRAKYANDLIEKSGVKYDIDLSDNENDIENHINADDFSSNYFKTLYDSGKVSVTPMSMNYKSKTFAEKVVKALTDMSKNEGPYYIHCVEGKDRTGFVLAVIEGLTGATYEEIIDDYMKTYDNYFAVTENSNKEKYDTLKSNNIDDMLQFIADSDSSGGTNGVDLKDLDWVNVMGRYLTDNGMTFENLDNLYKNLTNEFPADPG